MNATKNTEIKFYSHFQFEKKPCKTAELPRSFFFSFPPWVILSKATSAICSHFSFFLKIFLTQSYHIFVSFQFIRHQEHNHPRWLKFPGMAIISISFNISLHVISAPAHQFTNFFQQDPVTESLSSLHYSLKILYILFSLFLLIPSTI